MEQSIGRSVRSMTIQCNAALKLRCARHQVFRQHSRCISTTRPSSATPIAHPPLTGAPPPAPPEQPLSASSERMLRKKSQAEVLRKGQSSKSAMQRRFWREVSVQEGEDGTLNIHLDKRVVRTANRQVLSLPASKRALAAAMALEWDLLVSAQQALKHHYIPLTSLVSRANDLAAADASGDSSIRKNIVNMMMRYLATDTLLCWVPEADPHDPENTKRLRQRQRAVAEPIVAHLKTHVFPGVDIEPILEADSIVPRRQSDLTVEVIRGWLSGLPAYELAALERGVLATKSLLVAVRLIVEWSKEFKHAKTGNFGIEQAAEASTLEVQHQTAQWNEVEDTHDVDAADIRRQLGSAIMLVS